MNSDESHNTQNNNSHYVSTQRTSTPEQDSLHNSSLRQKHPWSISHPMNVFGSTLSNYAWIRHPISGNEGPMFGHLVQ